MRRSKRKNRRRFWNKRRRSTGKVTIKLKVNLFVFTLEIVRHYHY